jgi:hypothetical protein
VTGAAGRSLARALRNTRHEIVDFSADVPARSGRMPVLRRLAAERSPFMSKAIPVAMRPVGARNSPNCHSELPPPGEAGNGKSALRSVVLEIPISPLKGSSSSKIRKIAPANESAHTNRAAMTIRLI